MPKVTAPKARLSVNKRLFAAEARSAAYSVVNGHLTQRAIIAETLKMGPAKELVYITIAIAAVQKLMRATPLADEFRDSRPLPLSQTGYISRRAVSSATGLSRQTVRRLVTELLNEDRLISGPRGALAAQPGLLARPEIQSCLLLLAAEVAKIAEHLIDLGVLDLRLK